jgi:hypothetical protein
MVPRIPRSRLTANESRVPMNVISRTRTGIAYHRGGRGVGMLLGYTSGRSEEAFDPELGV